MINKYSNPHYRLQQAVQVLIPTARRRAQRNSAAPHAQLVVILRRECYPRRPSALPSAPAHGLPGKIQTEILASLPLRAVRRGGLRPNPSTVDNLFDTPFAALSAFPLGGGWHGRTGSFFLTTTGGYVRYQLLLFTTLRYISLSSVSLAPHSYLSIYRLSVS